MARLDKLSALKVFSISIMFYLNSCSSFRFASDAKPASSVFYY